MNAGLFGKRITSTVNREGVMLNIASMTKADKNVIRYTSE